MQRQDLRFTIGQQRPKPTFEYLRTSPHKHLFGVPGSSSNPCCCTMTDMSSQHPPPYGHSPRTQSMRQQIRTCRMIKVKKKGGEKKTLKKEKLQDQSLISRRKANEPVNLCH